MPPVPNLIPYQPPSCFLPAAEGLPGSAPPLAVCSPLRMLPKTVILLLDNNSKGITAESWSL